MFQYCTVQINENTAILTYLIYLTRLNQFPLATTVHHCLINEHIFISTMRCLVNREK